MDKYGLNAVAYGSDEIGGITDEDMETGTETRGEVTSGAVFPSIVSISAQRPTGRFSTLSIADAIDAITSTELGFFAAPITAGSVLTAYLHKRASGGGRATGSVHRSLVINEGLIHPGTLVANHQDDAKLDYNVLVGYDGSNYPIVPSDTAALPTGVDEAQRYALKSAVIGGVTLTDAFRQLEIQFGVKASSEGAASNIWDTHVSVDSIEPVVTLRGIAPTWFKTAAAVALDGLSALHAASTITLRKREVGGTFVDGSDITITLAGLAHPDKVASVQQTGPAETSIVIPLYHDGTNNPLIITTPS